MHHTAIDHLVLRMVDGQRIVLVIDDTKLATIQLGLLQARINDRALRGKPQDCRFYYAGGEERIEHSSGGRIVLLSERRARHGALRGQTFDLIVVVGDLPTDLVAGDEQLRLEAEPTGARIVTVEQLLEEHG